jgi:hypothetical protein
MKLLLDTCVWGGAREELTAFGHDVVWARASNRSHCDCRARSAKDSTTGMKYSL